MNPEEYVWDSSVKVWGFVYLTMLILCTLMNSSLSECAGDASFPSTLGALGFTVLLSSWLLCCQPCLSHLVYPAVLSGLLFLLSSMPRAALPLPYPTRDTRGLACVFRWFPQVGKTHRPFKGRLLQSILSLWNSNNAYSVTSRPVSCIFGQFFIHPFVSMFSNFFFSSQILEELVVLQFINYLLRHLPLIKITFQP